MRLARMMHIQLFMIPLNIMDGINNRYTLKKKTKIMKRPNPDDFNFQIYGYAAELTKYIDYLERIINSVNINLNNCNCQSSELHKINGKYICSNCNKILP